MNSNLSHRQNPVRQLAVFLFWIRSFLARYLRYSHYGRLEHWIYSHSYEKENRNDRKSIWFPDRRGNYFQLNPHSFIDASVLLCGDYEKPTQNFIVKNVKEGNTCFDIGANIGLMTLNFAKQVGEAGQVIAFEPHPDISKCLEENIAKNKMSGRVRFFNYGLSNYIGVGTLHGIDNSAPNRGMSSLVPANLHGLSQKIEVTIVTLDRFVTDHKIDKIDFIKIDIQGAEGLLLQGATETLTRFSPFLMIEIAPDDLAQAGWSPALIFKQLHLLGYRSFSELDSKGNCHSPLDINLIPSTFSSSSIICKK